MHACVECQTAAAEKEVVGLTANQAAEDRKLQSKGVLFTDLKLLQLVTTKIA